MIVTLLDNRGERRPPVVLSFRYQLSHDILKLVDSNHNSVTLQRVGTDKNPVGNATIELVRAQGINDQGDLLTLGTTEAISDQLKVTWYETKTQSLSVKQAVVGVVQDNGWQRVDIPAARERLEGGSVVAVWRRARSERPPNPAALLTLTKTLRPGTLVFILPLPKLPPP
jgi:hypothetical protein